MARKYGTSRQDIVDAAVALLDRGDQLTVSAVADEVGFKTPSFYYHFPGGLDELKCEVGKAGAQRLLQTMDAAGAASYGLDGAEAVVNAAADWVNENTQLFQTTVHACSTGSQCDMSAWDALEGPLDNALREAGADPGDIPKMLLTSLVGIACSPSATDELQKRWLDNWAIYIRAAAPAAA